MSDTMDQLDGLAQDDEMDQLVHEVAALEARLAQGDVYNEYEPASLRTKTKTAEAGRGVQMLDQLRGEIAALEARLRAIEIAIESAK